MNEKDIAEIEARIGYVFQNKEILVVAFTHSSLGNGSDVNNNERLEFLGDALLGFIVAKILFNENKTENEGSLSKRRVQLVQKGSFCGAVTKLGLSNFLQKEKNMTLSSKIISNIYEAVVGAIYLDSQDLDVCEQFFIRTVLNVDLKVDTEDYISRVKEWREKTPTAEVGYPNNADSVEGGFSFAIGFLGKEFVGIGPQKKDAEREACKKLYEAVIKTQ